MQTTCRFFLWNELEPRCQQREAGSLELVCRNHSGLSTGRVKYHRVSRGLNQSRLHDPLNTLRPGQNSRHFADDIFKCIFLNENASIPIKISLNFVPKGPINNTPALVHIMAWRRPGDKPLSETMMVSLPTHICVTRPQLVKGTPVILDRDM